MENITILAVREEDQLLVLDQKSYQDIDLINFSIVKERKAYSDNPLALLHAIAASPAKYAEHALQKAQDKVNSAYFLLNPLLTPQDDNWPHLLNRLLEINSAYYTIIATANDIPLGLFIPANAARAMLQTFMLRFLSFISATLDFAVLKYYFQQTQMTFLCINETFSSKSGFYIDSQNLTIYKLVTAHYLQAITSNADKEMTECIAVMPYHAGDALFLCYALKEANHPFSAIMINACYADIVRKILPGLKIYLINEDPANRGKNKHNKTRHQNIEHLYFLDTVYPKIPQTAVFQYLRPFRNCDEGKIHFIDQWKCSISSKDYPPFATSAPENTLKAYLKKPKIIDKSIFCHFDAGWHLKIYPYEYQKELIFLLKNAGYRITILADVKLALASDQYVSFTNILDFEKNVHAHAIFLGMDSFPSHFATHVLQHPCVTLFSSTEPENAKGPNSVMHKDLYNSLPCCPCRAVTHCPIYQADFCKNFTAPSVVFETIENMYQRVYSPSLS